jgi:hypothetical protein
VSTLQATLSSTSATARTSFDVAADTRLLRVAMNAHDDGIADFDLYVKQGAPPTPTSFDCARTGSGQFASCEFDVPAEGPWHVLVQRLTGAGQAQVNMRRGISRFTSACSPVWNKSRAQAPPAARFIECLSPT